jgi:pimeloyl-ACP methyl ester carboxylesterase
MGRGWKILIGVVALLAVLLAINTLVVEGETKSAEVTVPGGRILKLEGGEVQVLERGPRDGSPIVLIHCFTCAIDWWDGMIPLLDRDHRVIAVDLRGFGGSEKPDSGYSIPDQAALVAEALAKLGVRDATVAGHSLGGTVATALSEVPDSPVARLVIVDQAPDNGYENKGLPFTAALTFIPVIGPGLWRVTPDFAIKDGLGVAFAPGYDVPDAFVDDFNRMTYTAYDESPREEDDYSDAIPLDRRVRMARIPLLAIFGAEDQIYESKEALAAYAKVPGAQTALIAGSGHSPNVEKPAQTAALVLGFAKSQNKGVGSSARGGVVSQHGSDRRQQRRTKAQPDLGAAPRNRASGAGGAAPQQ